MRPGDSLIYFKTVDGKNFFRSVVVLKALFSGIEIDISQKTHESVVNLIADANEKIKLTVKFVGNESSEDEGTICKPVEDIHKVKSFYSNQINVSENNLEFRVIVGYLGTIEMQKQISNSSKHQIVKGCIRKMRQEKRIPTHVQMILLPTSLLLKDSHDNLIAKYSATRINYVGSNSDDEKIYFGLITTAIYSDGLMYDSYEMKSPESTLSISHSCHVFATDRKNADHNHHVLKAELFRIICTKDEVTGKCLEFPYESNYVVDVLKKMYLNRAEDRSTFKETQDNYNFKEYQRAQSDSPQSSNHSEQATFSSNSDSGVGFQHDCINISERVNIVDTLVRQDVHENYFSKSKKIVNRPYTFLPQVSNTDKIHNTIPGNNIFSPKYFHSAHQERPVDVPEYMLLYAKSAISDGNSNQNAEQRNETSQDSFNNFLIPESSHSKIKISKNKCTHNFNETNHIFSTNFDTVRPMSASFENLNLDNQIMRNTQCNWASLQNLIKKDYNSSSLKKNDATSEPNLIINSVSELNIFFSTFRFFVI